MTKAELQTALSTAAQTDKETAGVFLDRLSTLAFKGIKKEGEFVLPGFGKGESSKKEKSRMTKFKSEYRTHLVMLVMALVGAATAALAFTGQEFAKEARVSLKQAEAIALKVVPGKITDEELEKERGGSGLRYSFDIQLNRVTHEVGVDARTGAVLENSIEGAKPD